MKRVVFVCTGNTCRSPMAEGLFKQYLKEHNIEDIEVSSAGLYCFVGDTATENAVIVAKEHGADISEHRSRKLTKRDFRDDTYFVCMTIAHKQALQQIQSDLKIMSLGVSDPVGGDLDVYRSAANEICYRFNDIIEFVTAEFIIEPMSLKDIKQIAQIEKECFSRPWSEESLEEELDNPHARFYVAKDYTKVVGYVGAMNVCGEVSITNVAVKREFRNRGIASMLLKHLIKVSSNEHANFITLEVRESNLDAKNLYEINGFEVVGRRRNFYDSPKEDALLMTRCFY